MRTVLAVLALAVTMLAGCADEGAPPQEDAYEDLSGTVTKDTGLIRGVVFDATVTPVADASVAIQALQVEVRTGPDGAFIIEKLAPGLHFLDITKPGYGPVQRSVDVAAGVEKPELVKVQIIADPSLAPYVDPLQWAGYFTCSSAAFQVCPGADLVLCILGSCDVFTDEFLAVIEVQSLPDFITTELMWDPTQLLGSELDFYLEWVAKDDRGDWEHHRSIEGGSPLQITVDRDEAASLKYGSSNDMQHRVFPALAPQSLVFIEQEFTIYSHEFYNVLPPEGWRFSSGEPY